MAPIARLLQYGGRSPGAAQAVLFRERNPMAVSFVYITTRDKSEAAAIGQTLVDERLAACVNIFDGMQSIYRWEGEIEHASEAVLIAKTKESLVSQVIGRVKQLHSYTCPCVVSWAIAAANEPYLDWIEKETR